MKTAFQRIPETTEVGDWQDTIRHWDIEESGITWSREHGNVDRINLRLAT